MGTLNEWAGAIGGAILCIELIVLLLILVAINAGMAFGLWWVSKKMGWVSTKRIWVQGQVQKWTDKVMGIAAAPVIRTTSTWRGFKAGLYRATHWPKSAPARPAAPVSPNAEEPSRAA